MSVGQMNKSASENVSQESVPPLSLFSSKDIYIVRANQNEGRPIWSKFKINNRVSIFKTFDFRVCDMILTGSGLITKNMMGSE